MPPNKYKKFSSLHNLIDWCIKLSLLLIIIPVFVPFSPKMPSGSLDSSWALGLNQAVAQGLAFGKEIIFTLGPYSSIYTKAYHPFTDFMMISGSLYLALSYWLSIILLMNGVKWRWTFTFAILMFGMIYARDSLFFSYPLLVGMNSYKILYSDDTHSSKNKFSPFLFALLFAPFGLLVLIKGSLLILCSVIAIVCSVFFTLNKEKALALIALMSPIIATILFWVLAGQSIFNLPFYFINSISLASGFTEAMATDGNNMEIILYLIASMFILVTIAWQKHSTNTAKFFLLCLFFLFLFLSFKTGFTRHFGHSFIPGTSILMAALLLPFLFNSKIIVPVLLFSVYTSTYINSQHTNISILNNFVSTYTTAWFGFKNRMNDKNWARHNYDLTMNSLNDHVLFPRLQGTTDIYSYDQSYLIASGISWSPRPIFQSYSVFTPLMAKKNKNHLLSDSKPDNIIFKIEPIDDRFPSLDDGISWPELLNNYHPVKLVNDFLILKKNLNNKISQPMPLFKSETHEFGEVVKVPNISQLIFVEIEMKPTIWGLLAITCFKPDQLLTTVELQNGMKHQYRIIASMAKSGFLLSPLIEETAEFGLLYSQNNFLDGKKVKSFSITSSPSNTKQWDNKYVIHFKSIPKLRNDLNEIIERFDI